MTPGLHPTAAAMYRWIVGFKQAHAGDSPTRREIAAALELGSTSVVQHHLVRLARAGLVVLPPQGEARRIGIPGARWEVEDTRRVDGQAAAQCDQ